MNFCCIFLGLALAVDLSLGQIDDPLVVDAGVLGRIRGSRGQTYEENGMRREYVQFRGIPYAHDPTTRRFLPSELREEDLGAGDIFNATNLPPYCYAPFLPQSPLLTEDCLVINVYTHQKYDGNDTALRPVLFFIHGGAFTVGSGAVFSGSRLMNRDIVYVSFNYRLGLFGFFSLQNEDVPGNAGMYDAINALKWTKNHIKNFGGNPDAITISGQSAGAVMVTQMMVSPLAQGLFQRAIAASGSALNAWGTTSNPLNDFMQVANRLNCHDLDTIPNYVLIAECMRNADAMEMVDVLLAYQISERQQGRLGFSVASPVVQDFPMTAYEKVLPEHARVVFKEGRESPVPLLMSSTKHDGSYVLGVVYNRFLRDNGLENNSTFLRYQLVSYLLNSLEIPDSPAGIHESISRMYLGDSRLSGNFLEMYPGLMDIFSVFFFKGDAYDTALQHSSRAPTYWYSFDFQGQASLFGSMFPGAGDVLPFSGGVAHTDDLIYLYGMTFLPFNEVEMNVTYRMTSYWANFVATGSPSPDWPALNSGTRMYRSIEAEDVDQEDYVQAWVGPGYETIQTEAPSTTTEITTTSELTSTEEPVDDPLVVDAGILGRIRGSRSSAYEENGIRREYLQFRGIPYAHDPTTRRFLPSELREEDLGAGDIFNATNLPPYCYAPFLPQSPLLTEDCLVINVYTHKKYDGNDTALRPVLFFIHGGAFTVGSGSTFSGSRLMNRDIVYVSFNYRLGLFGFFSLQNEDVPGNAGMYDAVNALKWTKNHIKHFGGNPDAITISGQSAGAVMVTQMMVSPMAQGLFQRAIAASGSALNAWGTTSNPLNDFMQVASRLNCHDLDTTPNYVLIAECMRNADAMEMVDVLLAYQISERQQGRLGFSVASPVVQDFPMTAYEKVLPEHARVVFKEGRESQVPLMMSSTKHDGSYVLGVLYNRFIKDNGLENNSTFLRHQLVSYILNALEIQDSPAGIHESISRMYLGDTRFSGNFQEMYPGLMDIFSVFFFKGDAYDTALQHSSRAPTYWYSFDFKGQTTLFGSMFPGAGDMPPFPGGITHTDDLIYLYGMTFLPFNEVELNVTYRMTSYWADFAATGSPSSDWPALDAETMRYRSIEAEDVDQENYLEAWVGPGYETIPTTQPPTTYSPTPTRISTTTGSTTTGNPTTPTEESSTTDTSKAACNNFFAAFSAIILIHTLVNLF